MYGPVRLDVVLALSLSHSLTLDSCVCVALEPGTLAESSRASTLWKHPGGWQHGAMAAPHASKRRATREPTDTTNRFTPRLRLFSLRLSPCARL